MRRRVFLKGMAALGAASGFRLPLAHGADYQGKLFVFVQADGGWDPTSFCDPKTNTRGERVINNWARNNEVRQAGRIPYAPFAANRYFFEKYHDRMLVINGVDAQTNSHTVGVVHNWSGRTSEGFPTLSAILAAHHAPTGAIPYINFGGYSETGGLTRFTRLNNPDLLLHVAHPRGDEGAQDETPFFSADVWDAMASYRAASAGRLAAADDMLPGEARRLASYRAALAGSGGLRDYAAAIAAAGDLQPAAQLYASDRNYWSGLRRQAQLTVLAFKTGVSISADLWLGGFDSHEYNDDVQGVLLGELTGAVDYLWSYAEEQGVADRLVVMIGSDFGRTNFYNADDGKDHWPIGSYVIMEKGQRWTGRAVGETDGLHFAQRVNPRTLARDDAGGTIIYPKHVHKALRRYLGVEDSAGGRLFPFNNVEDFAFFG